MKGRLHLFALALFLITLLYDAIVWGALPRLPGIGTSIVASARREAPLAATYIALGDPLDARVAALQAFGEQRLTTAFGEGFERIRGDATVAMDLIFERTWNAEHRWLKTMYWAVPFLLLLTVILWLRRPKPVRVFGARR